MDCFFWPENKLTSDSRRRSAFHGKVVSSLLHASAAPAKAGCGAESRIASLRSVKIRSSQCISGSSSPSGFPGIRLLLYSLILNLELYYLEEVPFPHLLLFCLSLVCAPSARVDRVSPQAAIAALGLRILIVDGALKELLQS